MARAKKGLDVGYRLWRRQVALWAKTLLGLADVSGLNTVELEFDGDRKVRIGTDDPEGLSTAIRQAMPVVP